MLCADFFFSFLDVLGFPSLKAKPQDTVGKITKEKVGEFWSSLPLKSACEMYPRRRAKWSLFYTLVCFLDDGFDIKSEQEIVTDDEKTCIQNSQ